MPGNIGETEMITERMISERAARENLGEIQAYYQLAAERRISEMTRRGWRSGGQRFADK
jgi:hypothetical protein